MNNEKCLNCQTYLPRNSSRRRKFCNDLCRLQYNRSLKKKPDFEGKYNELVASMRHSISVFEKRAANAEKSSKEKSRPIGEKLAAGDMAREYQSVANEIKSLLEGSEMTYEQRIAAIYDVDPIHYD